MSEELPTYACSCLNVKIYAKSVSSPSVSKPSLPSGSGWETVCVDDSSIKTVYKQLTLNTRGADNSQQVSCSLCNSVVYRSFEGPTTPGDAKSGLGSEPSARVTSAHPMSPTKDRVDFHLLFQRDKQTWIQVCTQKQGSISGDQLKTTYQQVSPVFGVVIPEIDTTSPAPTPPTSNVPLPAASIQPVLNWPELYPPPPFVSSHPLFTTLAREAKKASASARSKAETEIQQFIEAKRREVAEYENGLKAQVSLIWKAWRNTQDKAPYPHADPRAHNKRHSMTNSGTGVPVGQGATVIRSFKEEPSTSPRKKTPAHVPSSSFSPSNATPRVQYVVSALSTSLRQTGMHMPRRSSPPPTSPSGDFDMEFTSQYEGDSRSKSSQSGQGGPSLPLSPSSPNSHEPSRTPKASNIKRNGIGKQGSPPSLLSKGSPAPAVVTSGEALPIGKAGEDSLSKQGNGTGKRKAVTFSQEPDVVTVTREIKSEKLQKIKEEHARGEEAMFDLDVEDGDSHHSAPSNDRGRDQTPKDSANKSQYTNGILNKTTGEGYHPDVVLSFSRAPSGSKEKRVPQYNMARSLPTTSLLSSGKLGLELNAKSKSNQSKSKAPAGSVEGPYVGELKRIMAGQTPTHRSAWRTGSFDPRPGVVRPDPLSIEENDYEQDEEDEEDEESEEDQRSEDEDRLDGDADRSKFIMSTSVPQEVPSMKRPHAASQDNDFEGAMSRSIDPGPALELLNNQRQEDGLSESDEEEDLKQRDDDDDRETEDLMNRMIEGRGSLAAQKILSHVDRGVPASMWRSMA
ncbi:hypothetical protein CPB86DRAFT_755849 [Serendipita vermifera]|nr:hypothetical protein CPB86DRAFT_755849 [Serendipita vermifera]